MNLRSLLVISALLPAGAAFAAIGDPCTADVTDANGNVTTDNFTERCDGAQVVFCAAPAAGQATVETPLNCAALFDGAPVGTCQDFGGDVGPNCAFGTGDACVFASADNPFIPFPCQGADSGCLNGTCSAGVGTCTPGGNGGTCLGSGEAAFCAPWSQQIGNQCAGWAQLDGIDDGGGTLSCTGAGTCTGVGTGGTCDDQFYLCASDTCGGGTCGGAAEGEGEAAEGEGDGGGNGRDDEPETPPASGCFNASGLIPTFAPIALVFMALRRRRRA